MPYPRVKAEAFQSFGGINQKVSQADLSVFEFLDISNLDFTSMGALQQRPGSQTFLVGPVLGQTVGFDIYGYTGTIPTGITGPVPIYIQTGASFLGGKISSIYEFQNLQGQSYIIFSAPAFYNYGSTLGIGSFTMSQLFYSFGGTFGYLLEAGTRTITSTNRPTNGNWSFVSFVNRLFMANGDHFYKWDGNNTMGTSSFYGSEVLQTQYSVSLGIAGALQTARSLKISDGSGTYSINQFAYKYCLPPGSSLFGIIASGYAGTSIFTSATYTYSYGFVNDRGFYGPVSAPITVSGVSTTTASVQLFGYSGIYGSGFSLADGYGIGTSIISGYAGVSAYQFAGLALYRDNGPGTGRYLLTAALASGQPDLFPLSGPYYDNRFNTSTIPEPTCINATLPPQFLEIYNNQMFMCGFSQAPSTIQFSDIGEPESIQPQNNFDVRTNDGDFLTGMKAALSQLFIFKNRSFHSLRGDNPDNFAVTPISDQYGCISNRAIAIYKDYMLFLDKKGIVLYNGASVEVISHKLDPIFANMNLSAASNNAWMIHNKQRNQVWCGIPVNGATMINQVIVYDYLLNAWTHFDGLNIASATPGFGDQQIQTVYFGGYSSYLGRFGASLTSDFGNAITMMAKTRFISEMGQSVEKMWRRLFINQLTSVGATISWNMSYYSNYSTSIGYTNLMSGLSFQLRSDFGISAKALSIQFYTSTSSDILTLQGFTIESRFQRNE